jgi:checkpoint serine/threonine-protein kinase
MYDQSNSNTQDQPLVKRIPQVVPEHHVREAMNPRTGRRERVFVNLEAVYPDYKNPSYEVSFEELRAGSRGWTTKHWKSSKKALKEIPDNAAGRTQFLQDAKPESTDQTLAEEAKQKLNLQDNVCGQNESPSNAEEPRESKKAKVKKIKMKEIGETQTSKYYMHLHPAQHSSASC